MLNPVAFWDRVFPDIVRVAQLWLCYPRTRDDTLEAMKKGVVALTEFADFSKAFDKVSYFTIV